MAKIRFRKTFNLGAGVKVTASKSGIGTSVGVKGARIGRGADGRTRITGSIPGTGLSAQHTVGSGQRRAASTSPRAVAAPGPTPVPPAPRLKWLRTAWIVLGVVTLLFVLLMMLLLS